MNNQIEYANQVLLHLTESVGRALPGVFAGLAIVVAFLVVSSVFRRFLRHLAGRDGSGGSPRDDFGYHSSLG